MSEPYLCLKKTNEEFEANTTPEARFANAVDRFMPLLHNFFTQGKSWQ
ncbi:MAG: HD domain-containing protein [Desulfovermiculus sp.]|nr:HD domain-containing protein [Desulfovermiculus sp.]